MIKRVGLFTGLLMGSMKEIRKTRIAQGHQKRVEAQSRLGCYYFNVRATFTNCPYWNSTKLIFFFIDKRDFINIMREDEV